ncbi:hypothetical protein [Candidatus Lokiarchaeum ossiferum]|uniref:hypothetical protein n=1 Tax=Candidatus Lokiarchaeum ossiferum TaxID=2951803 RepID=UPI00352FDBD7
MKNKYIKNEYGKIVKVEDHGPKVDHDKSQDDYHQLKQELSNIMVEIKKMLHNHLGQLQRRILKTNVLNIQKVFEYYFNQDTYRINAHLDTLFIQSFKQIKDMIRNSRSISDEMNKKTKIKSQLSRIKTSFLTQRKYIKKIYKQTAELKQNNHSFLSGY